MPAGNQDDNAALWVRQSVFVVHVGGTRCVTFSTDNNMHVHARITLTVVYEHVFFLFLFDV